jgi:N-ethylmaleimide reductase
MKTLSASKLFTPVRVGFMELEHRAVMAPLTRSRSVQPGSIPGDLMLEYYSQRASDGGLIVSEGTSISIAGRRMVRGPRLVFGRTGCGMEENHERSSWETVVDSNQTDTTKDKRSKFTPQQSAAAITHSYTD